MQISQIDKFLMLQERKRLFSERPRPSKKLIQRQAIQIKETPINKIFECRVKNCRRPADVDENYCRHHLLTDQKSLEPFEHRREIKVDMRKMEQQRLETVIKQMYEHIQESRYVNSAQMQVK